MLLWTPLPADTEARIQGQIADLPWQTVRRPLPPSPTVEGAVDAAEAARAAAVLWVAEADGRWILRIVQRSPSRVIERLFSPRSSGLEASAAAEALGLAVRSSLQAIAAGAEVGKAVERRARAPEPGRRAAAPAPTPRAQASQPPPTPTPAPRPTGAPAEPGAPSEPKPTEAEPAEPEPAEPEPAESDGRQAPEAEAEPQAPPPARAESPLRFEVIAGWDAHIDGHSELGQQGPRVFLGAGGDAWLLGLEGHLALPGAVAQAGLRVSLHTQRALVVGVLWWTGARDPLAVGSRLGLGIVRFLRTTEAVPEGFAATGAASTPSAAADVGAVLRWHPWPNGPRVGLQLDVGALVVPGAPQLTTNTGAISTQLWLVQPHLALGVFVRL